MNGYLSKRLEKAYQEIAALKTELNSWENWGGDTMTESNNMEKKGYANYDIWKKYGSDPDFRAEYEVFLDDLNKEVDERRDAR
uniref:Uncharacterized protein n=1 Tax=viral metagenome TaxID=1070528 RepID=A0A6H1Z708_9ZZZZ